MASGYYRFPTIQQNHVVFVCEDDLWSVSADGGVARRLTANVGISTHPQLSPDGRHIAFAGRDEGHPEIYIMPADGGPAQRLTFLGDGSTQPLGWTANGRILFRSSYATPFWRMEQLYTISPGSSDDGNQPQLVNIGPATTLSEGPGGSLVIGRNNRNPARWKRYRGGRTGQLWIDANGDGHFHPLYDLPGNIDTPHWLKNGRITFISDHEGIGNLYSCLPDGSDLQRHTNHSDFYARDANSDGERVVYTAGGDLYLFDPATNSSQPIPVEFHSPQTQRSRKFVSTSRYLNGYDLHPDGLAVAITSRGKPFAMSNWEGPTLQYGTLEGVRYRLLTWLNDGERLLAVGDEGGEERFVIFAANGRSEPTTLPELDTGRPLALLVNPHHDTVVFSNHRYELLHLDLTTHELRKIDQGHSHRMGGFDWSPDGEWVAYSTSISSQRTALRLWHAASNTITQITNPILHDYSPNFDPDGRYLYFLSFRDYNPVYDNAHFELTFPRGERPYLITLQKEIPSPFVETPRAPGQKPTLPTPATLPEEKKEAEEKPKEGEDKEKKDNGKKPPAKLRIDLDSIQNRIIPIPASEGIYGDIMGVKGGKILYTRYPIEGALPRRRFREIPSAKGNLYCYDLLENKEDNIVNGVTSFDLSRNKEVLIYRAGGRLRVLKAGNKPDNGNGSNRSGGWIDLDRAKVSVIPTAEWRQMFREAWRLQRDHFWTPDMSQIDWLAVYERYLPLVDRVGSRDEFSDLTWEMQGELGTSHCYEYGGDYRYPPYYSPGKLGADFRWDAESGHWLISHIVQGDAWDENGRSPLLTPGTDIQVGDRLVAINGRFLSATLSPQQALVNLAREEIALTTARGDGEPRTDAIKTLTSENEARYREWVENNRRQVHEATNGRLGYIHIPDMSAEGFAEFHRSYLAEVERDGLIIDVRYNGGGNVSQLLLEKLARRQLAYRPSRWAQEARPYPDNAISGPLVALTNEYAASDGDIFSHAFKLLKLGPLVGKRTWGGVIGIWPRHSLVDNTTTTQPEFATWFNDVGWGVENYGTDPDIEIDNMPQDYAERRDAQLQRAIAEGLALLEANPPQKPTFSEKPNLALPRLSHGD